MATATNTPREFTLAPLQAKAWLFLLLIPVLVVIAVLVGPQDKPLPAPAWLVTPLMVALVMLVPLALLKRRRVLLKDGQLVVQATLYTRTLPPAALDLDRARIIDLGEHTEYKPLLKTNGYALPGFAAGHYRLRNRAKAFCLLTDRERVLLLPQRDGAFLLLSPEKPQDLLDALKAARG